MTRVPLRSQIRLIATAMLLLSLPITLFAQETASPMPDIWDLGNLKNPQNPNQTPLLNNPSAETLTELAVRMETFRTAGYALPSEQDLSSYSEDTLNALLERSKSSADDCVSAVDMALFLDAHVAETSWAETLQGVDNPSEVLAKTLRKMYSADGVGDDLTGFITTRFPHMQKVDTLLKVHEVLPIINEHNIGSIASREAIWSQEIYETSQKSGWDEAAIKNTQMTMLGYARDSAAKITSLAEQMEKNEMKGELGYGDTLLKLEKERDDALSKLNIEARKLGLDYDIDRAMQDRRASVENTFMEKKRVALKEREKTLLKVLEDYESAVYAEELRIAKYQVQYAALKKYALPIVRGKCQEITKQGLFAQTEDDADPRSPEEKLLDGIITLPHDKLMAALGTLGVNGSEGFLNCLCHSAGYGSSGTSQTYHPDTIGTYDDRYSCQHPGDPCVVSGYGCTRHPLPSDPAIWKSCSISKADAATQPVTDAILSAMAKRAAVAAAKNRTKKEGATP